MAIESVSKSHFRLRVSELYKYRGLIWALTKRHLAQRYRGSLLGFLWSFLNPLCLMLVYMLVFQFYIRFDAVENYTIFLFCGLLPWIWFSSALIEGTAAISSGGHLITKSLFPAHILPIVSVLTSLVNYILSLPLLFIFMWFMGSEFYLSLCFLPALVAIQLLLLAGLTLLLGSLNVYFRDIQHIVTNLLTLLFFLCPIIYPISVVPERFRFTMEYNPLALLTAGYQSVILNGMLPSLQSIAVLLGVAVAAVLVGYLAYEHYHESFAELL